MAQEIHSEFFEEIKKNSGLTMAAGGMVLLAGLLIMGSPFVAGISVALIVGLFLVVGGIGQLVFAVKSGKGIFAVILGVLTLVIGGYMVKEPSAALESLTLFLALYLVVAGIVEALLAFQVKPVQGWGWALFSGVMSVLLGAMIWSQLPLSGAWAIGILIGVKLAFSGWTLLMFGLAARSAATK